MNATPSAPHLRPWLWLPTTNAFVCAAMWMWIGPCCVVPCHAVMFLAMPCRAVLCFAFRPEDPEAIKLLKRQLHVAISEEDYGLAARLRDHPWMRIYRKVDAYRCVHGVCCALFSGGAGRGGVAGEGDGGQASGGQASRVGRCACAGWWVKAGGGARTTWT